MLKTRVIPTLLWRDFGLVKGVRFDSWRRVGPLLPAVRVYNTRDVDELIVLDVTATVAHRRLDLEGLAHAADSCFVPLTVGGGINSVEAVEDVLHAGADKVCINTAAYEDPTLIETVASRFGSQCVVAGVDFRRAPDGSLRCFSHSGTQPRPVSPESWVKQLEESGAGELLVTSIDRDGTMSGFDLAAVQRISEQVRIPVIASGGAGSPGDFVDAVRVGGASAVAAASIFHFTETTPQDVKDHMSMAGIPTRSTKLLQG